MAKVMMIETLDGAKPKKTRGPRLRGLAGVRAKKVWVCDGGEDAMKMSRKTRERNCRRVTIAQGAFSQKKRSKTKD